MSVQIDNGEFTRLHNTILEKLAMARFTASEYRCLMFLFRTTYGWQKKEDAISLSQWAVGTGIDTEKRHNVLRTLQGLIAKQVIYAKSNGNNHAATWGFNKNYEQWDASLFDTTVISQDNSSPSSNDRNNETVINQDNKSVIPPDNTPVIKPHNTAVIPPDNHKRKELKKELKKEKETKPPARSRSGDVHPNTQPIMDAYLESLGYKPANYGQESAAAKHLAKEGYQPVDVTAAYELLKGQAFWQTKHLSLQTVAKEIPALKQALLKGVSPPTGQRASNATSNAANNRQAVSNVFAKLRAQQGVNGHG